LARPPRQHIAEPALGDHADAASPDTRRRRSRWA
jgi:hypothetical protein